MWYTTISISRTENIVDRLGYLIAAISKLRSGILTEQEEDALELVPFFGLLTLS